MTLVVSLIAALATVIVVLVAHRLLTVVERPLRAAPFLSGHVPSEHAVSRFHVRWYSLAILFLAFDVEMLFMYPWLLVVKEVGVSAVVEMFGFLGVLMAGVVYAWREGALRWA